MQSFRKADLSLSGNTPRSIEEDSLSIRSLDKATRSCPFQGTSKMFMHYTISEDRTGDDSSVRSGLLAGLGARNGDGVRMRDSVDTGLANHGVDDHQNLKPGDVVTYADDDSEAETLFRSPVKQWPLHEDRVLRNDVSFTGLHPSLSEETITRWFERFGEVKGCVTLVDPRTEDFSQYGVDRSGIVTMALPEEAKAIKEQFNSAAELGSTLNTLTGASAGQLTDTGRPRRAYLPSAQSRGVGGGGSSNRVSRANHTATSI